MTTLRITQRRSRSGASRRQLDTLRSLGLRRIGHTVEREDSPQLRGMIHRVAHLVEVTEQARLGSKEARLGPEEARLGSEEARLGSHQGRLVEDSERG